MQQRIVESERAKLLGELGAWSLEMVDGKLFFLEVSNCQAFASSID
jgi:hypothetical protein